MIPHSHMRETLDTVLTRGRDNVDAALPRRAHTGDDRPRVLVASRNQWTDIPARLESIRTLLDDYGAGHVSLMSNTDFTDQAKGTKTLVLRSMAQTQLDEHRAWVLDRLDNITEALRLEAFPPRPKGGDAVVEIALGNLRSETRMLLDPITDELKLIDKIGSLIARALGDQDVSAAWLLASSRWPADYLESRGLGQNWIDALDLEIQRVLDATAGGQLGQVREAYSRVIHKDAANSMRVALAQLDTVIEEYAAFRLGSAA